MLPNGRRITYKDISREDEIALVRRSQAGDNAAGTVLIQAHEPAIQAAVRRFMRRGLDAEDVMQAARFGFIKAMRRFALDSGNRLTTYATKYAAGYAQKALMDEGSTIRVGRAVTNQLRACRRAKKPPSDRLEGYMLLRRTLSLDVPVGAAEGIDLIDTIASAEPGPASVAEVDDAHRRCREIVERTLTWLNSREQEIVRRRFAEEPETFEQIGASMGFSKQRVEQIMKRLMPKLERAAKRIVQPDDAVLWGGDLPAGPMRRKPEPVSRLAKEPRAKAVRPLRPTRKAVAERG
jgi:RNA polymerase sigma factor (sigma-70 family)